VVLCHGFRGFKDWGFIPFLAERLTREGLSAVAFNFGGSGIADRSGAFAEPERFRRNTYGRELGDLALVIDWIQRRRGGTAPPIGLVGHSRGGAIALLHAARDPRVHCVATLAAPPRIGEWSSDRFAAWDRGEDAVVRDFRTRTELRIAPDLYSDFRANRDRYDVDLAVGSLAVPLLILHGDRDRVVPPGAARTLARLAAAATTEVRLIEGAGHTFQAGDTNRRTPPPLLDMLEAVTAWMRRWLSGA